MLTINQIADGVHEASREYPIKRAELFGSYAEGTNTAQSDVDILIEFQVPTVSLLLLNSVRDRLEDLLHIDVDLVHLPIPEGSILEIGRRVPLYGA